MNSDKKEINVDIASLKRKADTICNESDAVINKYRQLVKCFEEIGTMWQGEAKQRFDSGFIQDLALLKSYIDCIEKLSYDYRFAFNSYNKCESMADEIVRAIR